jgi:hypothetical protein
MTEGVHLAPAPTRGANLVRSDVGDDESTFDEIPPALRVGALAHAVTSRTAGEGHGRRFPYREGGGLYGARVPP